MSSCKHVWDVEQWSKVHVWKETMKDVLFFYLINIVILNRWSTPAWAQIFYNDLNKIILHVTGLQ